MKMCRLVFILPLCFGCTYQAPTLPMCAGDCVLPADSAVGADGIGDAAGDLGDSGGDAPGDPSGDAPGDPSGDPPGDPLVADGGDALSTGDLVTTTVWYGLDGSQSSPFGPQLPAAGQVDSDCYEYQDGEPHDAAPSAISGGISGTAACSEVPAIAADAAGQPIVVWHDWASANWEIYGKRMQPGGWTEMAGSTATTGISTYADSAGNGTTGFPDIVVAIHGALGEQALVAWHDTRDAGFFQVYLRRYDFGTNTWDNLGPSLETTTGGVSANGRASHRPQIAWRPPFAPVVVWEDRDTNDWQVFLKQFTGSTWEPVAASASEGTLAEANIRGQCPRVVIDSFGQIVVAWENGNPGRIYVRRTNVAADAWLELDGSASGGGISGNGGEAHRPSMAIDAQDRPVVAWAHYESGDFAIRVARFGPTSWQPVGTDGIAHLDTNDAATAPSLAVAPDGYAVVAWEQATAYGQEILLKRMSANGWTGLGGSEIVGGVSRSDVVSHDPRVLIAGDRVCVVWAEPAGYDMQIVMRCHDGWW